MENAVPNRKILVSKFCSCSAVESSLIKNVSPYIPIFLSHVGFNLVCRLKWVMSGLFTVRSMVLGDGTRILRHHQPQEDEDGMVHAPEVSHHRGARSRCTSRHPFLVRDSPGSLFLRNGNCQTPGPKMHEWRSWFGRCANSENSQIQRVVGTNWRIFENEERLRTTPFITPGVPLADFE